jgi:hypothetical protein
MTIQIKLKHFSKMKKLMLGSLLAGTLISFNSCLDGENSSSSQGQSFGVVEMSLKAGGNVIYFNDQEYPFYSPTLSPQISDGECCLISYLYKSEDNQNIATLGYYTVQEQGYLEVDKVMPTPVKTDTAVIKENELPMPSIALGDNYGNPIYIKGYLFINSAHESMETGQKNRYELSYDMGQEPVLENMNNVYQLYLRANKETDGKSPKTDQAVPNAYYVKHFFENISYAEKGKGKTEYYFKVNYIKSFSTDSVATWASTDVMKIAIPTE